MLTLRLQRTGRKHAPSFRVIATPKGKGGPKGKPIEYLGWMNPFLKQSSLNKERILHWISQGAQVSPTLNNLLIKAGVITGKKIAKHHTVHVTPAPAIQEAPTSSPPEAGPPLAGKTETLAAATQEASVAQPVTSETPVQTSAPVPTEPVPEQKAE